MLGEVGAERIEEMKDLTLVVGGTGKTGRRVAERLSAQGVPVRIGSRTGRPRFDWEDPATWGAALQGVQAAYVTYFPDLAVPGAVEAVRAFADRAVESGVERLVLLSGRGEAGARRAEEAVRASGAGWTILRSAWFCQNFTEGFFVDELRAGEIVLPVGDLREPFVDADDLAEVAVRALMDDAHLGQVYELTGPRLLSFPEAIQHISKATGREIRYVRVSRQQYQSRLADLQVPADFASLVDYLFTEVLDGRNASVTDGFERALGRPGRDFGEFAGAAAATGVWSPVPAGAASPR
jgi:uncharacterized protein YbjT (DUF2867 family)